MRHADGHESSSLSVFPFFIIFAPAEFVYTVLFCCTGSEKPEPLSIGMGLFDRAVISILNSTVNGCFYESMRCFTFLAPYFPATFHFPTPYHRHHHYHYDHRYRYHFLLRVTSCSIESQAGKREAKNN